MTVNCVFILILFSSVFCILFFATTFCGKINLCTYDDETYMYQKIEQVLPE